MGYRGKVEEQERARELRADGWTMPEIAEKLGVSRSSVSLWTRDVPYLPRRHRANNYERRGPNVLQRRKQDEIDRLLAEGRERIGRLSEREFLIAGTALYAGEGFKVRPLGMANTDPAILVFFVRWLRHFFDVDESRLKMTLYLHVGLDIDVATEYWSRLVDIFSRPLLEAVSGGCRPVDPEVEAPDGVSEDHVHVLAYSPSGDRSCGGAATLAPGHSGVAQLAERRPVKPFVAGPSPAPGATQFEVRIPGR